MEKPTLFPEKFFSQLVQAHYDSDRLYEAKYFIIIDLTDNCPQAVDVLRFHKGTALASLYNAMPQAGEKAPVAIVDREAALWFIGQTAIENAEYNEDDDNPDELNRRQPVYQLLPVFGAMIPNCLPKIASHE